MKVSVVMPFFDRWDLVNSRLIELNAHIKDKIEIILVDDASEGDYDAGIDFWLMNSKHPIFYYRNPENGGFGYSMNTGVQAATKKYVILLSNDVIIRGDFVTPILQKLSNNDKLLLGDTLYDWNTGWNTLMINGQETIFPYLGGYLLACTRELYRELGGFDELYGLFDFEDIDICTTALHKGYKLKALNLPVQHISGATIRRLHPNRERFTKINQKKFIEKWSKILK